MKKITIGLLLLVIVSQAFAQNLDSLYTVYASVKGVNKRIAMANQFAQISCDLRLIDTFETITNTMPMKQVDALVMDYTGCYLFRIAGNYLKAAGYLLQAAEGYLAVNDSLSAIRMYSNASACYGQLDLLDKAIELTLKSYDYVKKTGDREGQSHTLANLAALYSRYDKDHEAVKYFRKAIEIDQTWECPPHIYARHLAGLARVNKFCGNYAEALQSVQEAIVYMEMSEIPEKNRQLSYFTEIMGGIFVKMDSLQQAGECYQNSVDILDGEGFSKILLEAIYALGEFELSQKQYAKAEKTLKHALELAEKADFIYNQKSSSWSLYLLSKQKGASEEALYYLENYVALNDSIYSETSREQLADFQVRYETAEKELEIERQQNIISRQNTQRYILYGGVALLAIFLFLLWYMLRMRIRRNRALTEKNAILAESNATKDKFFSIISHDLKNPAIAQRNALQMLFENAAQWDQETLQNYYYKLLKSADTQVDILYSLLNWAQVQTNRMAYNPVPFDLVYALASDLLIIENMAAGKGVDFRKEMPDSALVNGDITMLCTIVRNLMTNAVKFTPPNGMVTLSIRPIADRDSSGGAGSRTAYRVTVSDTGIGISPDQIADLFNLNRDNIRRGTDGETGNGLGLIVCKELIEKHGSTLNIESEEGRGSTFWFEV